ncbi:MAG: hypothetical protein J6T15_00920 [Bacilli bacterium]|nr:hypothetical protein [Bacilli bacterium]
MKLYKKCLSLLLCCASTVLSGCSDNRKCVYTNIGSQNIVAFAQIEFDLIQKSNVVLDVSFGVAVKDTKTTWADVVYEYNISYFKLNVFNEPYAYYSYSKKSNDTSDSASISEKLVADVRTSSSTKVEEKKFQNEYINDGKNLKMFFVKQTISLKAEQFKHVGDSSYIYFDVGAFTTEEDLAERYQRKLLDGMKFEYKYSDGTVEFEPKATFMSYSPIISWQE